MKDLKYYIVYIKGNKETVLGEFKSEKDARKELENFKQPRKERTGAFQLLRACMLPDGKLDLFNRKEIASFCPEVEAFFRGL